MEGCWIEPGNKYANFREEDQFSAKAKFYGSYPKPLLTAPHCHKIRVKQNTQLKLTTCTVRKLNQNYLLNSPLAISIAPDAPPTLSINAEGSNMEPPPLNLSARSGNASDIC